MDFPTLYKKTSTGAIQQWTISTDTALGPSDAIWGVIVTTHGQVDGKLQTGQDTVREGVNSGKKNATTPKQQAEAEAKARWTKQLKKGYVESIEGARAGEVDAVIEGGILPMLSPNKSYPGDDLLFKNLVFPAFFQPKLDGMRCIAIIDEGVCTVWSRTRKRINTVPHIVATLEDRFRKGVGRVVLDGELYNHDYKDRFEDLLSLLRGDEPDAEGEYLNAEFHVYDCPEVDALTCAGNNICEVKGSMSDDFEVRNNNLNDLLDGINGDVPIKRVVTVEVSDLGALADRFIEAEDAGYEGGMARNKKGKYESGKRSKNLLKMKRFIDHEFKIIGVEDGRGKDAGTVAKFVCVTNPGSYPEDELKAPLASTEPLEFRCRLKATYKRRRELMEKPELWQGKLLTVRFKRWTAEGKPYIPVGQGIRDYE